MEHATLASDTAHHVHSHDAQYPDVLAALQRAFETRVFDPDSKLFTTDADGLFTLYLDSLPGDRQYHTCNTCRRFIERFGGLATIDESGETRSAIWDVPAIAGYYGAAIEAMRARVESAKVTGVFLSSEPVWGQPRTAVWTHYSLKPPAHMIFVGRTKRAHEVVAERREDFKAMITALGEFNLPTVETAITLLKTDPLYRSEKCLGAAEWLRDLIVARQSTKNTRLQQNILWVAVATAPAGFAHPRSSMIGTLLDDIAKGLPFADVSAKFAAKMHPLRYQRPQAAPSAGAIAAAEKLVEKLGIASSLERRFARLEDLQTIWLPRAAQAAEDAKMGVFSHLQAKGADAAINRMRLPVQTMTWEKFTRTVLPEAERIEILVPSIRSSFCAYLTAKDPNAPPILQWDREERRNPVSLYVYNSGSLATDWNLMPGVWAIVTALSLRPSSWFEGSPNQGDGVLFVIDGAKDQRFKGAGNALFPETLKSDLHSVRSVIEAYSRRATIHGFSEASACGLMFSKSKSFESNRIRVTSRGTSLEYTLDRWD